jgi:hypothetical protein
MINFNIGQKIKSLTKKSTHVIESIETVEGKTVIFTEDVKCFPIEDVERHYDSFVSEYFIKIFSGGTPTKEEDEKLKKIFQGMNLVTLKK